MAYLQQYQQQKQSWFHSLGGKVKNAAEIAGTVKGIFDLGKTIYSGVRAVAPVVAALL
jgi:hypothetical protein